MAFRGSEINNLPVGLVLFSLRASLLISYVAMAMRLPAHPKLIFRFTHFKQTFSLFDFGCAKTARSCLTQQKNNGVLCEVGYLFPNPLRLPLDGIFGSGGVDCARIKATNDTNKHELIQMYIKTS